MNFLHRAEHWGETHHSKWLDFLRIALGIFLCYKGIDFLNNMSSMTSLMSGSMPFSEFMLLGIGHYVVFAHILGGFLITIGLLTRFACLIQIPILIGAIFFVNSSSDVMRPYSELFISVLVLLLLVLFLIIGNGPWSVHLTEDQEKRS